MACRVVRRTLTAWVLRVLLFDIVERSASRLHPSLLQMPNYLQMSAQARRWPQIH